MPSSCEERLEGGVGTGQGAHSERGQVAQAGARTSAKAPGQGSSRQASVAGEESGRERQRVASQGREGQAKGALTLKDMGGVEDFEERSDMI